MISILFFPQVQAVQSLFLQQYLAGGRKGSLQEQLKMQQQYTASLAGLPGLAQVALFGQGLVLHFYKEIHRLTTVISKVLLERLAVGPGLRLT